MFGSPNYNFPNYTGYTPWYSQSVPQVQQQQQVVNTGINWVQGEAGAKSFAIAPGQSVLLMDSEENVFYIKSSDASGMPMPLRIFDYTERVVAKKETTVPNPDYVTREELNKVIAELWDAKQSIPAV